MEATLRTASALTENAADIYRPARWFSDAVTKYDLIGILLLTGLSILLFAAVFFIVGNSYRNINSALKSHAAAKNYRVKTLKKQSVVNSIAFKEFRRMTGSTVYMTNGAVGEILAVLLSIVTLFIGFDKINMLRHVLYFKDKAGVLEHMQQHKAILQPRFRLVVDMLNSNLSGLDVAQWNDPNGGYFVSVDVEEGCAKRVVALCKEAGVILTGAGATFPYGNDPKDSNIRIAPTYPPIEELQIAMEVFCIAVKLAAAEKYLNK